MKTRLTRRRRPEALPLSEEMQHVAQEAHGAKAGAIRVRLRGLADERDTELLTKEIKAQAAEEKKVHAHMF